MAHGHPKEPFWYALSQRYREELCRIGARREYQPEAVLVRERDSTDFAIVLLEGCVKVTAHGTDGYQAILGLRDPGDLLGELAGVDGGRRSATLSALTAVQALILPAAPFAAFLRTRPDAAAVVHRTVSHRLREADRYRAATGALSVPRRLAELLLDLGRRYGASLPDGGVLIELPISQNDLAGLVLTSHRTLARTLEQWRTANVVVTGRRSLLLVRPGALREIAAGGTIHHATNGN